MMNNKTTSFLLLLTIITCIACFHGCAKYHDLMPSEVPQAPNKKIALTHINKSIRDIKFYREFVTEALFNVLWKSPTNSNIILDLYADRRGLSKNKKQAIIDKNEKLHSNSITFFVLAYVIDRQRPDLHDSDATWTLYLKTENGHKIAPSKIRPMDITPELATIFEKRNTNFKQLYLVKFPRKYTENNTKTLDIEPLDKNQTLHEEIVHDIYDDNILTLVINSVELEEEVSWTIEPHLTGIVDQKIPYEEINESDKNEDFDWI